MSKFRIYRSGAFAVMLFVAIVAGCSREQGPDIFSASGRSGSGISGTGCPQCHLADDKPFLNPLLTGGSGNVGKHSIHYTDKGLDCELCHDNYESSPNHFDGKMDNIDPSSITVIFDDSSPLGAWINDVGAQTGQCAAVACHGPSALDWYGTAGWTLPDCEVCHLSPELPGINPVLNNGTGTAGKHVAHGFDCEKCHEGYPFSAAHMNGVLNSGALTGSLVVFDATNPSGAWVNDTGAGLGECMSLDCHGSDLMEWYTMATWTLPSCTTCHSAQRGTRRAVMGSIGNFADNASNVSFHVANTVDPADAQCLICHEQSEHMGGTVRLANADDSSVVEMDDLDLSSAEPFCLSCHDSDGALNLGLANMAPFDDGNTLGEAPYRMSAEIKTHWTKTYGHHIVNSTSMINSTTKLTCLGTGEPGTGCHMSGHGSEFSAMLARNMNLPNEVWGSAENIAYWPADAPNFAICFDCHANYPRVTKEVILGVKSEGNFDWSHDWDWYGGPSSPPYYISNILTSFRDTNTNTSRTYDDAGSFFGPGPFQLHFYHLDDLLYTYRDNTSWTGTTCITCHNVHGSDTRWGWMYDEFEYAHYNGTGSDEYAKMNWTVLGNYPINCDFNCHMYMPNTSMWFEPANED